MAVCRSRSGLLTEPRESRPYGAHIETACGLEVACVLSTATPSGRCACAGWWPVRVPAGHRAPLRAPRHDVWSRRAGGAESAQPLRGMFRSSGSRPAGDVMRRSPIGLLFHVSDDGHGGRRDQGESEGAPALRAREDPRSGYPERGSSGVAASWPHSSGGATCSRSIA